MRESTVNYQPETIVEHRIGSGSPPVLLLHGWGGDEHALDCIGIPLSEHRRTISLSLPGFGNSPEPPDSWGTWEYVDIMTRWFEYNRLDAVDVIAHSFGGRIAIALASISPHLVKRLVLIGSAGLKPVRSLKTRFKIATAKAIKGASRLAGDGMSEYLEKLRNQLGSSDWRSASPIMRGILVRVLQEDLTEELGRITVPTLLIWGRNDLATPPEMGKTMELLIPDSRLVIIPGCGHFCYLDRKGEVLSLIWKHLDLPPAW